MRRRRMMIGRAIAGIVRKGTARRRSAVIVVERR